MNETNKINLESNVIQRKVSVNILAALPFYPFCLFTLICDVLRSWLQRKSQFIPLISLHPLDVETLMIFTLHDCPKNKILFLKLQPNYATLMRQKGRHC